MHIIRTMDITAEHYDEYITHLFETSSTKSGEEITDLYELDKKYYQPKELKKSEKFQGKLSIQQP